jgi:hypothetical protein
VHSTLPYPTNLQPSDEVLTHYLPQLWVAVGQSDLHDKSSLGGLDNRRGLFCDVTYDHIKPSPNAFLTTRRWKEVSLGQKESDRKCRTERVGEKVSDRTCRTERVGEKVSDRKCRTLHSNRGRWRIRPPAARSLNSPSTVSTADVQKCRYFEWWRGAGSVNAFT